MATGSASVEGLTVTGELRGGRVEEGRDRQSGEGRWPDRYILSVLAGDDTFRIECRDESAARALVGESAALGAQVTIPVLVRAAKGYVFYVARGGVEFGRGDELSW